jgi:hypothetical protein
LHNRREIFVGFPTWKAIIGDKLAAWYADIVLAKNGYSGQQTNEPAPATRQDNLWKPVTGDRGAYGDFTSIAADRSFTLWLSINRRLLRSAAGGLLLAAYFLLRRKRRE